MSLIEEIAKLRELEQSLFPGKWKVDEYNDAVDISPAPKETRVHGYGYGDQGFICDLNDGEYHEYYSEEEQANTAKFIAESRNLAPVMLSVLECFRVGDAERLARAAERLRIESIGWQEEDRLAAKEDIDAYRRLQKAARLMEQEEREG